MNVIIFEGIATSGKTTLIKLLEKELKNVAVISENDTLMGLIENKSPKTAYEHLNALLGGLEGRQDTTFIIDRFHLTHAFRTNTPIAFFGDIENRLNGGTVLLVLLTVDPQKIKERIEETTKIRAGGWSKGKDGTIEERVDYYASQQEKLKELFTGSALPKIAIDTTEKSWDAYAKEILTRLGY
jgi:thymidylate kinase